MKSNNQAPEIRSLGRPCSPLSTVCCGLSPTASQRRAPRQRSPGAPAANRAKLRAAEVGQRLRLLELIPEVGDAAPVRVALHEQLADAPVKLGSMSLILIGVMLISVTPL